MVRDPDKFRWNASPDGVFSTKSAYKVILGSNPYGRKELFQVIWNWKGTERIKYFLWKLAHKSILTNLERARRHIAMDAACPFCLDHDESLLHLFRDCNRASRVWLSFSFATNQEFWREQDWNQWLINGLVRNRRCVDVDEDSLKFGVTLDWIGVPETITSSLAKSLQLMNSI